MVGQDGQRTKRTAGPRVTNQHVDVACPLLLPSEAFPYNRHRFSGGGTLSHLARVSWPIFTIFCPVTIDEFRRPSAAPRGFGLRAANAWGRPVDRGNELHPYQEVGVVPLFSYRSASRQWLGLCDASCATTLANCRIFAGAFFLSALAQHIDQCQPKGAKVPRYVVRVYAGRPHASVK